MAGDDDVRVRSIQHVTSGDLDEYEKRIARRDQARKQRALPQRELHTALTSEIGGTAVPILPPDR